MMLRTSRGCEIKCTRSKIIKLPMLMQERIKIDIIVKLPVRLYLNAFK